MRSIYHRDILLLDDRARARNLAKPRSMHYAVLEHGPFRNAENRGCVFFSSSFLFFSSRALIHVVVDGISLSAISR